MVWANVSLYYFSYFYLHNKISLWAFNIIISISAVSNLIANLFSIQLGKKIGMVRLIRIGVAVFCTSLITSSLVENIYVFIIFYSVICGAAIGLVMIPIFYIIYDGFGIINSGKVTGVLFACFGLSSAFFNILDTEIINPHN